MSKQVFISYSTKDQKVVNKIVSRLSKEPGITCWMAPRKIGAGEDWPSKIAEGIDGSQLLVLVFSESVNSSEWVYKELVTATGKKLKIIPFMIDKTPMISKIFLLTSSSHRLQAANPPSRKHLAELVEAVRSALSEDDPLESDPPPSPLKRAFWQKPRFIVSLIALLLAVIMSWIALDHSSLLDGDSGPGEITNLEKALGDSVQTNVVSDSVLSPDEKLQDLEPTPGPVEEELTTEPQIEFGSVTITSSPQGAMVWIDGVPVGRTPIRQYRLEVKSYEAEIRLAGFEIEERIFFIEGGRPTSRHVELRELRADLFVSSTPDSADVTIDGRLIGITPHSFNNLDPGLHSIRVSKRGYHEYRDSVQVNSLADNRVSAKLEQIVSHVTVKVIPSGLIYINKDRKAGDSNVPYMTTLVPGEYEITAVHLSWGRWTKLVTITGLEDNEITFDFTQKIPITVISSPSYAKVYDKGSFTGKYTPCQLTLRPGDHRIEVFKDRYRPITDPVEMTLETELPEPLNFKLVETK